MGGSRLLRDFEVVCSFFEFVPFSKRPRNVNYHLAGGNKRENTNGNWKEGKSLRSRLGNYVREGFKRRDTFTFIWGPSREVTQGGHV